MKLVLFHSRRYSWFQIAFAQRVYKGGFMEAHRVITKAVNRELVVRLPDSLGNDQEYEVIVLPINGSEPKEGIRRRRPSARLAGSARLSDDLIASAVPESDWESC